MNKSTTVKLGKDIPPKKLEEILVAAAQDIDWRAEVEDYYEKEYNLGTSSLKEDVYQSTSVKLTCPSLSAVNVTFWKNVPTSSFVLLGANIRGSGIYPKDEEVEKYLTAVSQRVSEYRQED